MIAAAVTVPALALAAFAVAAVRAGRRGRRLGRLGIIWTMRLGERGRGQ